VFHAHQLLEDQIDGEDGCTPEHQAHEPGAPGDLPELQLRRGVLLDIPIFDGLLYRGLEIGGHLRSAGLSLSNSCSERRLRGLSMFLRLENTIAPILPANILNIIMNT
jgi:hypothetical protein